MSSSMFYRDGALIVKVEHYNKAVEMEKALSQKHGILLNRGYTFNVFRGLNERHRIMIHIGAYADKYDTLRSLLLELRTHHQIYPLVEVKVLGDDEINKTHP